MQGARRPQHVQAVAAAHLEVAQHDVEVAVVQPRDGEVAVRGLLDVVARFGQPACEASSQGVVVVGNQDASHN